MNKKILLTWGVCLLITVNIFSVNAISEINEDDEPDYQFDIKVSVSTNKKSYMWLLGRIIINIKLENLKNETTTINYYDYSYSAYTIRSNNGNIIYHYPDYLIPGDYTPITLEPHEQRIIKSIWRQKTNKYFYRIYLPVLPGDYSVTIRVPMPPTDEYKEFTAHFRIRIPLIDRFIFP